MNSGFENLTSLLGWTLVNSIWQSGLVAAVLWIIFITGNRAITSRARYYISIFAMSGVIVWSLNFAWSNAASFSTGSSQLLDQTNLAVNFTMHDVGYVSSIAPIRLFISRYIDYIVWMWFAGLILFTIRLVGGFAHIQIIRNNSIRLSETENLLNRLRKKMGVKIRVSIAESIKLKSPIVIGHIKPIILFPVGFVTGLSQEQLELVIAHELAHIRRNDFLVNILQKIVETIYFFNPFVWWISNQISAVREETCDEEVIELYDNEKLYVETLLRTYEYADSIPSFGMSIGGAGKQNILNRIKRITSKTMENKSKGNVTSIVVLTLLIAGIVWMQNQKGFSKNSLPLLEASMGELYDNESIEIIPIGYYLEGIEKGFQLDTIPKINKKDFDFDRNFMVPEMEVLAEAMERMADINFSEIMEIPPIPPFVFGMDTIFPPHSRELQKVKMHMELMEKELEKSLRKLSEIEFVNQERMLELEEQLRMQFEDMEFDMDLDIDHDFDFDLGMEKELERFESGQEELREQFEKFHDIWQDQLRVQMSEINERLKNMPDMEKDFKKMEEVLKEETKHLRQFEVEIKEELVRDGYIDKDQSVDIIFNSEEIKVNGTKLKKKDFDKYQKIRKKYFPRDNGGFRYRE